MSKAPIDTNVPARAEAAAVEWHGFDPIPDDQRRGKPFGQFTLWFGSQMHMSALVLGGIGIGLGLGLVGTITAIVVGNILGALGNSLCVAMGPRYGMPQLPMGRAAFGYKGNYLPAFLASLLFIGWGIVALVLCAQALQLVWAPLPTWLIILVLGVAGTLLAVYGYDWIHHVARWLTVASLIVFIVLTVLAAISTHPSGLHSSLGLGSSFWKSWGLEMTIAFSFAISWAYYAADYSRYLPASSSRRRSYWYSFAALALAASWVMILGALLTTLGVKSGALSAIPTAAHGFADVVLIVLVISQMISLILNLYSCGMSCLTWGAPTKRWVAVSVAGLITLLFALLLGGPRFVSFYKEFLFVIGYFVTPWLAIVAISFYRVLPRQGKSVPELVRDFYRPDGPFRGIRASAYVAFFLGIIVSIPFIATDVYTGPIGNALGGTDISYFVSFVIAGIVYYIWTEQARHGEAAATGALQAQKVD